MGVKTTKAKIFLRYVMTNKKKKKGKSRPKFNSKHKTQKSKQHEI
jgi:hypothetical protein